MYIQWSSTSMLITIIESNTMTLNPSTVGVCAHFYCTGFVVPLHHKVVKKVGRSNPSRGFENCLSLKHAMKWLLSLCGGSDGGLGEPS